MTNITRQMVIDTAYKAGFAVEHEDEDGEPCDEMIPDGYGCDATGQMIRFAELIEKALIEKMKKGFEECQ